jgi:2-polyprenyl-3-methyl-5-hydroxy-6-metoxy-1,4-benzoquinol methylase
MIDLEFTGERIVPDKMGVNVHTWIEHLVRYMFAMRDAAGKKVIDLGCGTGYGTWMLNTVAELTTGVDRSSDALQYAEERFGSIWGFEILPYDLDTEIITLPPYDLAVCFEVLEHLDNPYFLLEHIPIKEDGKFICSIPFNCKSEFHKRDFTPEELREWYSILFNKLKIFIQVNDKINYILPGEALQQIRSMRDQGIPFYVLIEGEEYIKA